MQTRKMISNISYNSSEFMKGVLIRLQKKGLIDYWCFIRHKPEKETDPEADPKEHIHLLFQPSKSIQTASIDPEFFEPDPNGNELPLRCLAKWNIVNSFGDWWLYALHEADYLRHKGLKREFNYSINDMEMSHRETFERMSGMIDLGKIFRRERIYEAAWNGLSFSQAYANGIFGDSPNGWANIYNTIRSEVLTERKNQEVERAKKWADDYKNRFEELENMFNEKRSV